MSFPPELRAAWRPATESLEKPRPPRIGWIAAASLGTVLGAAWNSFRTPVVRFHFTSEGFLGQNTYAGGADKASHFVSFWGVARMLTTIDEQAGLPPAKAQLLGAGVSELAGLVIELGDGTTHYGFSYEDLVLDTMGAATALVVARTGLDDLIGFRWGWLPAPETPCCLPGAFGMDYTKILYTADLKLAGLAKRSDMNIGPARFLLLSFSYGSKGYPYSAPIVRQRQFGIEVGLHLSEVMRALSIPENRWWSRPLYFVADLVRFPYTAIGFRYDLNRGGWHGPDTGGTGDALTAGLPRLPPFRPAPRTLPFR